MMKKFTTFITANIILLFSASAEEAENSSPFESISEALQSPYQYQTVNIITGEYCENCIDVSLKNSAPLELRRYYTSQDPIAHGWHFNHPNILHSEGEIPTEWIPEPLHYTFDDQNRLTAISTENDGPQRIRFQYSNDGPTVMEVETEDNQHLEYTFDTYKTSMAAHPYVLTQVKDKEGREINYQYIDHPRERRLLLSKREEPEGRYLITEYYDSTANNVGGKIVIIDDPNRDPRIGKVKQQKAPVGPDHTPVITNRFFYGPGLTEVYDAIGNKIIYRYGKFQKLIGIDHYWSEKSLYRKEKIYWDANGRMSGRAIEDKEGKVHLLHTYSYDTSGNISKTTIWGNLSGTTSSPIEIFFDGQPVDQSIEHYSTYYDYSEDGKHLFHEREDSGLEKHYRYKDENLVAKLIGEEGKIYRRYFYKYDDNGIVVEEIEDDGSAYQESDLSHVTERRYTRITPSTEERAKGKPELIEKGFIDPVTMQDVLLTQVALAYSEKGEVVHKTIFNAELEPISETVYAYDEQGRLIYKMDENDDEQSYEYDLYGNLIKQSDGEAEIRQVYDYANRLIKKEQWKEGELSQSVSYQYDFAGNMTASTDSNGNETHYAYDPMGRLIKTTLPAIVNRDGIPIRPSIKENYDIFDRVVQSTDPKGYCTKTCYNAWGKPTAVIHPDGTQETFEYYLDGSLKKKISQQGSETHFERDVFSRVTKEVYYDHKGELIGEKSFTYSPFRLLSETTMDGYTTNYTYDGAGRQIKIVKGERYKLEITYDASGQVESKKEWYGDSQDDYVLGIIERDDRREVIAMAVQDASGRVLRQHEIPDVKENEDCVFEDKLFYNSLGQHVLKRTEVNKKGESTTTTFDALNRPVIIERKNSLGAPLTLKEIRYDLSGNKEREIHHILVNGAESGTYEIHWTWGPDNRLDSVTEGWGTPLARATSYHYNSEGLLDQTIKPDNVAIFFEYDSKGAITRLTSSDATVDFMYSYDDRGRVAEAVDNITGATTSRRYDQSGKMSAETLANGMTLEYDYDLLGRLRKLVLPDKSGIQWNYNAAFLTSISRLSESGKTLYSHRYTDYDLKGRLQESEMIRNLGSLQYEYHDKQIAGIHSPYWNQCLEYDQLGRITSMITEDPFGSLSSFFEYDELDQITSESGLDDHAFTYDSIGNLASIDGLDCTVDSLNQLTNTGSHLMNYDKNGQLIECWENGQHYFFTYDALGRLLSVKKEKEHLLAFTYDAFGRRMSKTVSHYRSKDDTYQAETSETYLWEGENEIGAVNAIGETTQLRILGHGLGAEVGAAVAVEFGQKLYAPIHDHRGNVSCLIDAEKGIPVEWYHYSAFGACTPFSMQYKPVDNPWRFSSKRIDKEANLVYFGKRYYMPGIGRWISKDPLGTPESINRYTFSLNQPMARIDPYGLFSFGNLWESITGFIGEACHYANVTLTSLKNKLSFEDYIRPTVTSFGELVLGKTLLQMTGFYQDHSESGVHGKGELNDKVRITLVNGILNARCDYRLSLDIISRSHGGVNIHYLFDATNGWTNDLLRAGLSRLGYISPISYQLAEMWRQLIDEMGGTGDGGLIIHYAHSIGATHTKNALSLLSAEERSMIRVYTFGSPTMISDPNLESVKNFISYRDGVAMLDPVGFIAGLFGLSDNVAMVGSPWGVPFIEHTLNGGAYYDIIKILGVHFLKHYVGVS